MRNNVSRKSFFPLLDRSNGALASLLCLISLCLAFSTSLVAEEQGSPAKVVHVVMVWLKEPGNVEHRQRIIDASYALASIEGLERVRAGVPLASERAVVDDSFDVGLTMVFASQAALQAYQQNPAHKRAQREIMRPLAERVVVYDFLQP